MSLPIAQVQDMVSRGIARSPEDYSVRADVVDRASALQIAVTLDLYCRYDKPGSYYTFSTRRLRHYQDTEVLR